MSFWSLESIKTVVGGAWLARPEAAPAVEGLSTDSRAVRPGQVFLALRGERTDGHRYLREAAAAGAALLVIDRAEAVPADLSKGAAVLLVPDAGAALLRLAGAYRRTLERTRVIAVGGSNGKTTTVRLIHAALGGSLRGTASAKSFNNAVGVPLTILAARRTDQYLLCEVGTNAPGEIAALASVVEPDVAVITSIGREHLEGLATLRGVVQEEASLVAALRPGGVAVVTGDSPELVETVSALLGRGKGRDLRSVLTFGFAPEASLRITSAEESIEGVRFTLNGRRRYALGLLGLHNASNAAAAVAVARRLGVDDAAIEAGLAGATGPEMRLERSTVRGVRIVNDAYNANPESTLAAISTFGAVVAATPGVGRRVLVLGDMLEQGDSGPDVHREIGDAVAAAGWADLVVLVGRLSLFTADRLARTLPASRMAIFEDLDGGRAMEVAALLRPGDAVLLKGSRGMGLERIAAALRDGPADAVAAVRTVGPKSASGRAGAAAAG